MRNILRWILVLLLLGVIIFLLFNLFNRSKNNAKKDEVNPPVAVEKSDNKPIIVEKKEEEITTPIIKEETVEVGDTASFAEISVFIGVFTIAAGALYLKKKVYNN